MTPDSAGSLASSPLHVVSLGAGVQSTALLLLALEEEIEADCAIFADTGWEPRAVYDHLGGLMERCDVAGFPVHVVTAGNIRQDATSPGRFASLPFHLAGEGGDGMARRQCTKEYKVSPIRRKLQEIRGDRPVVMHLGISLDEIQRMRDSDRRYITHSYPLVDRRWRRDDCKLYLASRGVFAPRSACVGCPFHSDDEWLRLTDDELQDAADFEQQVQQADGRRLEAVPFLHRSRLPLLDAVQAMRERDAREPRLWDDECSGVCGV